MALASTQAENSSKSRLSSPQAFFATDKWPANLRLRFAVKPRLARILDKGTVSRVQLRRLCQQRIVGEPATSESINISKTVPRLESSLGRHY